MAKILLVEDDNNLREIYEARLQAEGYDIVSAKDGEEALVIAKKERPDLIIADVMMPRVSGFEMLDILRNTPELKDVHVIMLTALGQAEDKTRADSLGADRYLVKSQVTLEDIVKAAADVLAGAPASTPAIAAAATDGVQATIPPAAPALPITPAPPVVSAPAPAQDVATIATPALPPVDFSAPQPAVPASGTAIPVTVPDTALPAAQPPVQQQPLATPTAVQNTTQTDTTIPAIPEPTATDAKLMNDAVNNLVAGSPQDITTPAPTAVTPIQDVAAPQPTPPPVAPVAPTPPLTMQPIITSPAPPTPVTNDVEPVGRKAIQPPAPDASTSTPDLNDLMAKEGHSLDENDMPQIFTGSHMPGNVISPGANDQIPPPSNPAPTDPNSISL